MQLVYKQRLIDRLHRRREVAWIPINTMRRLVTSLLKGMAIDIEDKECARAKCNAPLDAIGLLTRVNGCKLECGLYYKPGVTQVRGLCLTSAVDCVVRFLFIFGFSFLIVGVSRHVWPEHSVLPNLSRFTQPPSAWLAGKVALYITDKLGMSGHYYNKKTKAKSNKETNYTIYGTGLSQVGN